MRYLTLPTIALIAALPAAAPAQDEGSDLMRRGMEMFLEGLQDELSPALREFSDLAGEAGPALRDFLAQMGPAFADILKEVQDWSAYHPPEILPNGDIILRRKQPGEMTEPPAEPGPNGEIEL